MGNRVKDKVKKKSIKVSTLIHNVETLGVRRPFALVLVVASFETTKRATEQTQVLPLPRGFLGLLLI